MRSRQIHVRLVLSSLLAVLALTAVAASAAQAAEGPFYKISGTRLASGKTQEVKAKGPERFQLLDAHTGRYITCEKEAFAPGSKLVGSTGANFGSGEVTLEFSECQEEIAHEFCGITGGKIKSEPLKMELAYLNNERKGPMAVVFKPVTGHKVLVWTVKTGGIECGESVAVIGSMAAELTSEVGKEPAAAKTLVMNWPGAHPINEVWVETSGALADTKFELQSWGDSLQYYGDMELELSNAASWGVFTK